MRLINVSTFEFKDFYGEIPKYAILSHTWGAEEVILADMLHGIATASKKAGFRKIQYTCEQAARESLEWAWVDTCCIDKTNPAELSEAINSMYQWYTDSAVCYAFLTDVSDTHSNHISNADFIKSRWFTRGWTLQELVAPSSVHFYNDDWDLLGTCSDEGFAGQIELATDIPRSCLLKKHSIGEFSVATRMSWASHRTCTRAEDIAYCLLGIFDVNLPLLYGEGMRAFQRLQEEIILRHDDHTILAWTPPSDSPRIGRRMGVLAPSPICFATSTGLRVVRHELRNPSTMTKLGLSISDLKMEQHPYSSMTHLHKVDVRDIYLNCGRDLQDLVKLRLYASDSAENAYYRLASSELEFGCPTAEAKLSDQIFIRNRTNLEAPPHETGGIFFHPLGLRADKYNFLVAGEAMFEWVFEAAEMPGLYDNPDWFGWNTMDGCIQFHDPHRPYCSDNMPLRLDMVVDSASEMFSSFRLYFGIEKDRVYICLLHSSRTEVEDYDNMEDLVERLGTSLSDYQGRVGCLVADSLPVPPVSREYSPPEDEVTCPTFEDEGADTDIRIELWREDPGVSDGEIPNGAVHFLFVASLEKRQTSSLNSREREKLGLGKQSDVSPRN